MADFEINGKVYDIDEEMLWTFGKDAAFETIGEKVLEDEHRWWNQFSQIVRHKETNRFFQIWYQRNASESQDGQELDAPQVGEVEPYEVTVTKYRSLTSEDKSVA